MGCKRPIANCKDQVEVGEPCCCTKAIAFGRLHLSPLAGPFDNCSGGRPSLPSIGVNLRCGGAASSSPPRCGEGGGGGGREKWHSIATTSRPPTPTLPHKGGGRRSRAATAKVNASPQAGKGVASGVPNEIALSLRR